MAKRQMVKGYARRLGPYLDTNGIWLLWLMALSGLLVAALLLIASLGEQNKPNRVRRPTATLGAPEPTPSPTISPTPIPASTRAPVRSKIPVPAKVHTRSGKFVHSTAYCLTGTMYNGRRVYDGAVAVTGAALNSWAPLGSRWKILSGPMAGKQVVVSDKIGHSSEFDIAMPGRCQDALNYGRRTIRIKRISDKL